MKKGTRICAAGLLALTVALGAAPALGVMAPATALAQEVTIEGQTIPVGKQEIVILRANGKDYKKLEGTQTSLATALSEVKAGDTIVLGEGTFDANGNANDYWRGIPFSIEGAGAGLTTINGSIWMGNDRGNLDTKDVNEVSISDLTLAYSGSNSYHGGGIWVNSATYGLTVNVDNVELKGLVYGVSVQGTAAAASDDVTVNLTNVKTDGVWCAVQYDETKNALGSVSLADGSNCVYAVDVIGKDGVNTYYTTVADYEAGANGVPVLNGNVVTDDTTDQNDFENQSYTIYGGPFYTVATNDGINYTKLENALNVADAGETVSVVAETKVAAAAEVNANDVTLELNGNMVTFDSKLQVKANNFTAQNGTLAAGADNAITFSGNATSQSYLYTSTLRDVTINNAGSTEGVIELTGGNLNVEGGLVVVPNMADGAQAGIVVTGTGTVSFAADATVSFKDVSVKNLPFAKLMADAKGVTGKVTSANSAIVLTTEDVDVDKDGFGTNDYTAVYASMQAAEAQDAEMTRLYNPYTGEHLYTSDADEVQDLVTMGWENEGVEWVAPAEGTEVYRLYNPYTGEHHYTTEQGEYDQLVSIGWKGEGVKFYSAGEDGAPVYRLFNPYADRFAHVFTTDGNEVAELQKLGWQYEGVGFYGVN